jgi:NADH-quinone oxidoreductase subunit J
LLDQDNGFMVPFEFVSVLLLVAMIGAVLLSKKENSAK